MFFRLLVRIPSFTNNQQVKFIGGEGIIRKFQYKFGSWDYLVKMEMGQYPDFGRIGAQTIVLSDEGGKNSEYLLLVG